MNTKEIRALTGMNRTDFARRYHIPLRTLEHWDAGDRTPPEWAVYMLERLVKMDIYMDRKDKEIP